MPKVSIIIPAYNAERVLARCLDSVLAQTFTDFELLVMDDGSKDGTAALCDAYAAKDARVRVVHKQNSGVSDTRNQALISSFWMRTTGLPRRQPRFLYMPRRRTGRTL